MSDVMERERIPALIQRLDATYAKGLMDPKEYKTLRRGLEKRLPRPSGTAHLKKPGKKPRYFKLKVAMISIIAAMILITIPFLLNSRSSFQIGNTNVPNFEITNVRIDQGTLSLQIKNIGTAEAHNVDIRLRHSSGETSIRVIDLMKPQDSLSLSKTLDLGSGQQTSGVQFNIVVTCKEGVTKNFPFKQ